MRFYVLTAEAATVTFPWLERLRDWWRCSVCGSRFGHHNPVYVTNHKLRTRMQDMERDFRFLSQRDRDRCAATIRSLRRRIEQLQEGGVYMSGSAIKGGRA